MSQYTLELRKVVKDKEIDEVFGNFPIFDEGYREVLVNNIINYYYFREIGVETAGRFIFNLKARMMLIMPYYNQLYESTLLEFDPLKNYDVLEVFSRELTNQGETKNLYSDTPQGREILENEHLTEINQGDSTDNANESSTRQMSGNIGVQTSADLLKAFRSTFINIDKMIIDELQDLFIQIYN